MESDPVVDRNASSQQTENSTRDDLKINVVSASPTRVDVESNPTQNSQKVSETYEYQHNDSAPAQNWY